MQHLQVFCLPTDLQLRQRQIRIAMQAGGMQGGMPLARPPAGMGMGQPPVMMNGGPPPGFRPPHMGMPPPGTSFLVLVECSSWQFAMGTCFKNSNQQLWRLRVRLLMSGTA